PTHPQPCASEQIAGRIHRYEQAIHLSLGGDDLKTVGDHSGVGWFIQVIVSVKAVLLYGKLAIVARLDLAYRDVFKWMRRLLAYRLNYYTNRLDKFARPLGCNCPRCMIGT